MEMFSSCQCFFSGTMGAFQGLRYCCQHSCPPLISFPIALGYGLVGSSAFEMHPNKNLSVTSTVTNVFSAVGLLQGRVPAVVVYSVATELLVAVNTCSSSFDQLIMGDL